MVLPVAGTENFLPKNKCRGKDEGATIPTVPYKLGVHSRKGVYFLVQKSERGI